VYFHDQIMDELGYVFSTHGPHHKFTQFLLVKVNETRHSR